MAAVGEADPAACVFVGDRPRDDIYGAKQLGMRAVLVPHSDVPAHDTVVPDAAGLVGAYRPLVTDVGADMVSIQVMSTDPMATIDMIGKEVLPALRSATA